MNLRLLIRILATVVIAALVAGLPMSMLVTINMDAELRPVTIVTMMLMTLALVFCVGVPVALTLFYLVRERRDFGLGRLLLVGNAIGLALVWLLAIVAGSFGVVFFGIPTMLAVNVLAIAGWSLVLKPYRLGHV